MRLFPTALLVCGVTVMSAVPAEPVAFRFQVEGDPQTTRAGLIVEEKRQGMTFVLQWLHADLPAQGEAWTHGARTEGRFQREGASIVQCWFTLNEPRVGVLHLRADKPGALGFRISFKDGEAKVGERRRLTVTAPLPDGRRRAVRAWVFPMESEVTPEEDAIRVEGEGEALVLVTVAEAKPEDLEKSLAEPLHAFGFGDGEMPDLAKVWRELDRRQAQEAADQS